MSAEPARDVPAQRGDETELFQRYDERLYRITRARVRTGDENVADACAFAWQQLLAHQPRRESVFKWLTVVARREAIRLDGLQRRVLIDDFETLAGAAADAADPLARHQAMQEARERLAPVNPRNQLLLFSQAIGCTVDETAERFGLSVPRVSQLMSRSREIIREHEGERVMSEIDSPRARLLAEIQRQPPPFLRAVIGKPPKPSIMDGRGKKRLDWSRVALKIIDHRLEHGISDPGRAFGKEGEHPRPSPQLTREIDTFVAEHRPFRPKSLRRGLER